MAVTIGPGAITFSDSTTQSSIATSTRDRGQLISITTFTASGTFTAPSGCRKVLVKIAGGGGGSAGYCESGGAGGYTEGMFALAAGTAVTVTIGGGGGGVGYYAAAGNGGTTTFGTYLTATGG